MVDINIAGHYGAASNQMSFAAQPPDAKNKDRAALLTFPPQRMQLLTFAKALQEGDAATVKAISVATTTDEGNLFAEMAAWCKAMSDLAAANNARFGPQPGDKPLDIVGMFKNAKEKQIKEDLAALEEDGKEVLRLMKIRGEWHVVLATFPGRDTAMRPGNRAYTRGMTKVAKEMTAEVSAGKYKSGMRPARP